MRCLVVCLLVCAARGDPQTVTAFDDRMPTPEMVRQAGYPCESHTVETEDGYSLTLHRIPGGKAKPLDPSLGPVFLQHGLMDSSADWVLSGPDNGLGYILADLGYDVWLGNARGNIYSRNHKTIPTSDIRFWNWTWHEMGYFDLPASVDYVLKVSGHPQLHYIGHSMGTTMFFVLCSTRQQYNAKIRSMTGLAPVVFMGHVRSPIKYLAPFANSFQVIADYFGAGEFVPKRAFLDKFLKLFCEINHWEEDICENVIFLICGFDPNQFDEKLLPLILGHNPSGESTKTLVHYAQEIKSHYFRQYDYGPEGNSLLYNSSSPPVYNISLVTAPVSLIYALNDYLAAVEDVSQLYASLKNPVGMFAVNLSSFNHLDFLWGKDVKRLVYQPVVSLLRKFQDPAVRCVRPQVVVLDGELEVEARPCPMDYIKGQLTGSKTFMANHPAWRESVLTHLRALSTT